MAAEAAVSVDRYFIQFPKVRYCLTLGSSDLLLLCDDSHVLHRIFLVFRLDNFEMSHSLCNACRDVESVLWLLIDTTGRTAYSRCLFACLQWKC